jgi:hypothetical protein
LKNFPSGIKQGGIKARKGIEMSKKEMVVSISAVYANKANAAPSICGSRRIILGYYDFLQAGDL